MSQFYVDRVEEANLLEAYDVSEIPTHQRVDSGKCGQGNVLHVGTPPRAEDLPGLVLANQPENLQRHWQYRPCQGEHLLMKFSNRSRR